MRRTNWCHTTLVLSPPVQRIAPHMLTAFHPCSHKKGGTKKHRPGTAQAWLLRWIGSMLPLLPQSRQRLSTGEHCGVHGLPCPQRVRGRNEAGTLRATAGRDGAGETTGDMPTRCPCRQATAHITLVQQSLICCCVGHWLLPIATVHPTKISAAGISITSSQGRHTSLWYFGILTA
jgi:hypothetical protein